MYLAILDYQDDTQTVKKYISTNDLNEARERMHYDMTVTGAEFGELYYCDLQVSSTFDPFSKDYHETLL